MRISRAVLACVGAAAGLAAGGAGAQPRLTAQAGPTVIETGSAYYRFERFAVASRDGRRHYDVRVGIPRRPAPRGGFAAVYMLDGGAAVEVLDEALLARLEAAGHPPVLVAIGYVGQPRFDVVARAYDDTPPDHSTPDVRDDQGRPGGGADAFLRLIERRIRPVVSRMVALDRRRQRLWGHSYGGLFVLHAAMARHSGFSLFAAADPALWWNYGSGLRAAEAFAGRRSARPRAFSIMVGADEGAARPGRTAPAHPMRRSVPSGAARDLARRLEAGGHRVGFAQCPGAGHGAMFRIGLVRTLLDASRAAPAGESPSCDLS